MLYMGEPDAALPREHEAVSHVDSRYTQPAK